MTTSIHLALMGDDCKSSQSLTDLPNLSFGRLNHINHKHLRREELVSLIEETTSEFVAVVDSQRFVDLSQLNQLNNLDLTADPSAIHVLPFNDSESFIQSIECLPPVAAFLSMNPLEYGLVLIPKSAFSILQNLPDSVDILWHTLILLTQTGVKHRCVSSVPFDLTNESQLPLPKLAPKSPKPDLNWLNHLLHDYQPDQDFPSISSQADAIALKAGLLCIHDYLDESHVLSQSVQNQGVHQAGDYWHYIMHRREADFSNAKYWSRVVGYHPIHDTLPELVRPLFDQPEGKGIASWKDRLLPDNRWSLNAFVDCCAECESGQAPELSKLARRLQWIEMQLLLQKTSLDAATV
ncbi:MAG: hypothetical protein QM501_10200 [Gimesia sp.]